MKCEICGKGPTDGVSVLRVNAKGIPGIWRCRTDLGASAPPDPEVMALVNVIDPAQEEAGTDG